LRQPLFESQPKRAHFPRCLAFGFNLGHALARPCRGQKYASRVDGGTENLTRRRKRGDVLSQMRVFRIARALGRVYNQKGVMRMLTAYIIAAKQVSVFS
jgi:hypothetical protein